MGDKTCAIYLLKEKKPTPEKKMEGVCNVVVGPRLTRLAHTKLINSADKIFRKVQRERKAENNCLG